MNLELFGGPEPGECEYLGRQAVILRGFALPYVSKLLPAIQGVAADAPYRNMVTPGGYTMSVALTNCGPLGWITDRRGYRYSPIDPQSGRPWPIMPAVFQQLARAAASQAGFTDFEPDACLLNRYVPGSRMSLHQDKDEQNVRAPIVSVSLGVSAVFLFGGLKRSDKVVKVPLYHADVVVWGGEDRMRFHGVAPIKQQPPHPLLGCERINFTFRQTR